MPKNKPAKLSRRAAFRVAGVVAAAGAAMTTGQLAPSVRASQLRPGDPLYHFDQYEAIVSRNLTVRQLFQWPNIANTELYANVVNALNAWQFAYDVPADQMQIVVQAYASATVATLDDYIWTKYRIGDTLPSRTGQGSGASTNPFFRSAIAMDVVTPIPSDQNSPYYFDLSIEGMQRRGVLFLTCNNSLRGSANSAFKGGRNPDNLSLDQVVSEFQAHLVPGALLVPAGVTELVRLQDKGYRLVVNG